MRNLPIIIGISAICAFAAELPVCEEFNGEEHVNYPPPKGGELLVLPSQVILAD